MDHPLVLSCCSLLRSAPGRARKNRGSWQCSHGSPEKAPLQSSTRVGPTVSQMKRFVALREDCTATSLKCSTSTRARWAHLGTITTGPRAITEEKKSSTTRVGIHGDQLFSSSQWCSGGHGAETRGDCAKLVLKPALNLPTHDARFNF